MESDLGEEPMNLAPLANFAKTSLNKFNSSRMLSQLNGKSKLIKGVLGTGAAVAAGITAKKLYDYNKARKFLAPDELRNRYPIISKMMEPIYNKMGKPLPTPQPQSTWEKIKGYFASKPATPQAGGRKRRIKKKVTKKRKTQTGGRKPRRIVRKVNKRKTQKGGKKRVVRRKRKVTQRR